MSEITRPLLALAILVSLVGMAVAGGDPTRRADRLEPLVLDATSGFSVTRYEIETGVYYRWRIESDGLEEYKLLAPELFRESWIDQVVIEDKEVKPSGCTLSNSTMRAKSTSGSFRSAPESIAITSKVLRRRGSVGCLW